jgi:AraC-like DNA-binding protein
VPRHHVSTVSAPYGFTGNFMAMKSGIDREHSHGEIELNLLADGTMRYLFAGGVVEFPQGRWLAYWAALPHRVLEVSGDTHFGWITVPLETYLGWCSADHARRLLAGEILCQSQPQEGMTARAKEWTMILKGTNTDHRRIVALEVEALVRRLALSAITLPCQRASASSAGGGEARPRRRAQAQSAESLAMVEAMCRFLGEHYRRDLSVKECARAAGLHHHYAMALFPRTCGTTIGHYLCRLRLAQAQRLLLTTETDVLSVALSSGFGSQARFYVAFKRAYGVTPAAYRRTHRALVAPSHPPGEW